MERCSKDAKRFLDELKKDFHPTHKLFFNGVFYVCEKCWECSIKWDDKRGCWFISGWHRFVCSDIIKIRSKEMGTPRISLVVEGGYSYVKENNMEVGKWYVSKDGKTLAYRSTSSNGKDLIFLQESGTWAYRSSGNYTSNLYRLVNSIDIKVT